MKKDQRKNKIKFKKKLDGIVRDVCGGKSKHTRVKHTTLNRAVRGCRQSPPTPAARHPSSLLCIPIQGQGSHVFNTCFLHARVPEDIKIVSAQKK